jgi:ABC-type branched-subunit amino acid transport system substrate-binding protein
VEGFTYRVHARVSDPDGWVSLVEVCIEDGCTSEGEPQPDDVVTSADTCVRGHSRTLTVEHTFGGPGSYAVVARAHGGGCPVVGAQQVTITRAAVEVPEPPPPIPCATEGDPFPSDTGVDATRVRLGATVARSGLRANDAEVGIRAAVRRVNDTGGVCGRALDVEIVDDGGDAQRGHVAIRTFIAGGTFGLVSVPSTDGLGDAIRSGDIDAAGIPVLGTPGADPAEFTSPWVWPVGPAAASFGRISVEHAYARGARRFGLVYDKSARFGTSIAEVVSAAVGARPGAVLAASRGINPGQPNYSSDIAAFNQACDGRCDAVVLALDAATAETWMAGRPQLGTIVTSGFSTLFSQRFAGTCGEACDRLHVWTGYEAPIGPSSAAVQEYARAVWDVSPSADVTDPQIEAAYAGTLLAAYAIGRTGVDLTRTALQQVLDHQIFDLGLTPQPLDWTQSRHANRSMRPYSIVIVNGSFAGFRAEGDAFEDPGT